MPKQSRRAPSHALAALVGASILAAGLGACDSTASEPDGPEYLGICVDRVTQLRVPDQECGLYDNGAAVASGYLWDYIDTWRYPSFVVPAYGYRMSTTVLVVHAPPRGVSVSRSVPRTGGSASSVRSSLFSASRPASGSGSAGKANGSSSIQRGGFGVSGGRSSGLGSSAGS